MLEETKNQLIEWGHWVRSGGVSLGYAQVNLQGAPAGALPMADDEAMRIDRAVAQLKRQEPDLGQVLTCYYVRSWDYAMVGEAMGLGREKVRVLLRSAEAWVGGRISEG